MRAFVAVTLSGFVQEALASCTKELKKSLGADKNIRWVKPENYHLTLCFLGEIPDEIFRQIEPRLRQALADVASFSVELSKIDLFPSVREPHAIVAAIRPQANLVALQQKIFSALVPMLPEIDTPKSFLPHITLARIKGNFALDFKPIPLTLSYAVQDIHLFESRLSHAGPQHQSRFQIRLKL